MPHVAINGVKLYYEVHGDGFPLIWCHEFAGSYRSWARQVEYFRRDYRVVVYNARGYPPSDVPTELPRYSQEQSIEDLRGLLETLGIQQAHVGGLSMGSNVALNFGLTYPRMTRSLILAGIGTGSANPEVFRRRVQELATRLETEGMAGMADYPRGPDRVQLLRKDPERWRAFSEGFLKQSNIGSAMVLRGVLGRRPAIFELEAKLRSLDVPTLILVGDEDEPCIEPSLFLKRCISPSGLMVFPQSGHAVNVEEPDLFNHSVRGFLKAVHGNYWARRESGITTASLVGAGA